MTNRAYQALPDARSSMTLPQARAILERKEHLPLLPAEVVAEARKVVESGEHRVVV